MKKLDVQVQVGPDDPKAIARAYGDLLQGGYEIRQIFSTYSHGKGSTVYIIGVRETPAKVE